MEQLNNTFNFFGELESRFGFTFYGENANTNIDGYHYSLNKQKSNQYLLTTSINFNNRVSKNIIVKTLAELFESMRTDNTIEKNHRIFILFKANNLDEKFLNNLETIINKLNTVFKEYNLKASCWNCNKEGNYSIYRKGNISFEICDDCVNHLNNHHESISNENAKRSYLKGFIGAFIGASLGGALWILMIMLGIKYLIVGFFIGFFSVIGYFKLNGKRGKGMIWVLSLAIIIVVVITNIIEVSYSLYINQEYALSLMESFMYGSRSLYDSNLFYIDRVWTDLIILAGIALVPILSTKLPNYKKSEHNEFEPLTKLEQISE